VIVDDLQRAFPDGLCEISARVRRGDGEQLRLWYRFPEELAPAEVDGSPFLAGVLVWAMRAGEDVTVDGPVSPRLLGSLEDIFRLYYSFFPGEMRQIAITAPLAPGPPPNDLTGSFFTRGVDSWYAVLTALQDDPQSPPLTHLVFCPDFLPRDRWSDELVDANTEATRAAAAPTGCRFVTVYSNQKRDFRGHQLVAMALALGMRRMLIPSGGMRGELRPRATHPQLDPRFSTERTEIVHYGDATRMEKVARIAQTSYALQTIHVCRYNESVTDDNCGRCEKCLRTMLQLHTLDALNGAARFEAELDPMAVARMSKKINHPHQWVEILHSLDDTSEDRGLAAAVRLVIIRAHLRNAYEEMLEYGGDPDLAGLRPDLPDALQRAHWATRLLHRGLDPQAPRRGLLVRLVLAGEMLRALRTR
jgi:hypothetical protein